MQKTVERILKETAKKFDVPYEVVKASYESQFKCAREKIQGATEGKTETHLNVRFKNFGFLYADHRVIKAIEYARDVRSSKNNEKSGDSSSISG